MISLLFILLLIYYIDFGSVIQVLTQFNKVYLFILLIFYATGIATRALRWKIIINNHKSISFIDALGGVGVGYMANSLLPVKAGELIRIVYLGRKKSISKSYLLGTIFIERSMDLLLIMFFLSFSVFFSETIQSIFRHNLIMLLTIIIAIIAFIYVVIKTKLFLSIIELLPKVVSERLIKIYNMFLQSFQIINNKLVLFKTFLLTLFIWLLAAIMCFVILSGLDAKIPYYAYFFVVSASVLGMAIPSAAGGIGVYHAISTGALLLFGVNKEVAITYALISHAIEFIPNIALGMIVLFKDHYSIKSLIQVKG